MTQLPMPTGEICFAHIMEYVEGTRGDKFIVSIDKRNEIVRVSQFIRLFNDRTFCGRCMQLRKQYTLSTPAASTMKTWR